MSDEGTPQEYAKGYDHGYQDGKADVLAATPAPLDVERLARAFTAAGEAAFALSLHNQTPTGRLRECLPGCVACQSHTALRAALAAIEEKP